MYSSIGTDINKAALLLQQGKVVGIPTETVYGLACNAMDTKAVEELYRIKERSALKALPIQVASVEDVFQFAKSIPDPILTLMKRFCPGPLTVVLAKSDLIPDIITAGMQTIAIRIPDHATTLELLRACPFPLAVTSANISGNQSLSDANSVLTELNGKIAYVLDGGKSKIGNESTIIGFDGDQLIIYRIAAISLSQIQETIPDISVRSLI